ncbi:hypothetical protein BDW67DRAFT_153384 [Aspergillus spinulosporus]
MFSRQSYALSRRCTITMIMLSIFVFSVVSVDRDEVDYYYVGSLEIRRTGESGMQRSISGSGRFVPSWRHHDSESLLLLSLRIQAAGRCASGLDNPTLGPMQRPLACAGQLRLLAASGLSPVRHSSRRRTFWPVGPFPSVVLQADLDTSPQVESRDR